MLHNKDGKVEADIKALIFPCYTSSFIPVSYKTNSCIRSIKPKILMLTINEDKK